MTLNEMRAVSSLMPSCTLHLTDSEPPESTTFDARRGRRAYRLHTVHTKKITELKNTPKMMTKWPTMGLVGR